MYWADWEAEISEAIRETTALREAVGGREIVNHRMLAPQVFETTYAGGVKVTVNYSAEDFDAPSGPVPAHDYIIDKEGGDNL